MDVNLDHKIQALESVFKNDGFVWIIKFWQTAYRTNDGKVTFDSYHGVIHAENCRVTPEKHLEILKVAQELELLYKTDDGKYTSNGIQKRIEAVNKERERWRKKHGIELSNEITPVVTPEEPRRNSERKGKESKEKEREENTVYRPVSIHLFEGLKQIGMQPLEKNLHGWDKEVRLMVEQDKRSVEDINLLIDECRNHPLKSGFTWSTNIRSMGTLREKWNEGKIWIGMNKKLADEGRLH